MGHRASIAVRTLFASSVVVGLIAACGTDGGSSFTGGATSSGGTSGGSSSGSLGGTGTLLPEAGASPTDCKPKTCAEQGIECGPAGDGCGGIIADCGKCATGLRCGGPNALSKCVSPSIGTACTPKSCADQGVECGLAGDGCGGVLTCPTCGSGQQCGAIGNPSKCVSVTAESADGGACVPKTISDYKAEDKNCGTQSDGCGNTIDLGGCTAPEFCGGGGPSKCAISGGGVCTKKTCADYPGLCGPQPDGCGGVTPVCGTACPAPQVCGGGGTPSVCGGGSLTNGDGGACAALTTCGAGQCGKIANGCGGVLDCGTAVCTGGQICGGGGTANQCGAPACVPLTACPITMNCGSIADGCGGTVSCGGACTTPGQICGGAGSANVCGGGGVVVDGGAACVPATDCTGKCGPIADGCGGILACANSCVSPNLCGGGGTPNVCGGGNQCTPKTAADCTAAGLNCGFIADGCGKTIACGVGGGACPNAGICGGNTPDVCTNGACVGGNFCTHVSACGGVGQHKTRVTGTVYAPNGTLPLPGATVYVPNGATTQPFGITNITAGVTPGVCDTCNSTLSGSPLVSTTSGDNGSFTLDGVPDGVSFPLVVQMGKWRGWVQIPIISACGAYAADGASGRVLVRFPTSEGERDGANAIKIDNIPLVAVSTGSVDAMECVYKKMGVAQNQFTSAGGGGRIKLYSNASGGSAGASISGITSATNLYASEAALDTYDAVIMSCGGPAGGWGDNHTTERASMKAYADHGGRLFATHYQYGWLYGTSPWGGGNGNASTGAFPNQTSTVKWTLDAATSGSPGTGGSWVGEVLQGAAGSRQRQFYNWLTFAGITSLQTGPERVTIDDPRRDATEPVATTGVEEWIKFSANKTTGQNPSGSGTGGVLHYTFNTPFNSAPAQQCGRVLYSDFHVSIPSGSGTGTFPAECSAGTLNDQEKILAFFLFDLTSCITTTTCQAKTCADYPANTCGQQSDGCGGLTASCGTCTLSNQTCGGGGTVSVCGGPVCPPKTCPVGDNCGSVPDGCGLTVSCGTCASGVCGGGGQANKCGTPVCTPRSCATQGIECGSTGDGCGNVLPCPACPAGTTCGGGGIPNHCGKPACTPATTCPAGKNCGDAPDGCGGSVHCGDCVAGQTCGGGGSANVCGAASCSPKNCADQGAQCGSVSDQCGGVATCAVCPDGDFCNGENLCIAPTCTPKTCAQLGVACGPTADTCGGLIADCGACPTNQACGAAGIPGQCGNNPCTPKSCADLGAVCGQVADGCGGLTPDCGACQGALSCKNGACVTACAPRSCKDAGAQCGAIADGCGSIVDCGPCPPGEECGFNNNANVCGAGGPK